jgi:hypothetical protein
MIPQPRKNEANGVESETNVEIDSEAHLTVICNHGSSSQWTKNRPWENRKIQSSLNFTTMLVGHQFSCCSQSIKSDLITSSKTYASCWEPAPKPDITDEAIMVGTSLATIATIEAIMPTKLPKMTKYLRPKISDNPPESGREIDVVIVLADTIQL